MALNPSSSGMQKCQQAGSSCSNFDVREMWSDFHDQKSKERHQGRAKYCTKQEEKIAAGEEIRMYQYR